MLCAACCVLHVCCMWVVCVVYAVRVRVHLFVLEQHHALLRRFQCLCVYVFMCAYTQHM